MLCNHVDLSVFVLSLGFKKLDEVVFGEGQISVLKMQRGLNFCLFFRFENLFIVKFVIKVIKHERPEFEHRLIQILQTIFKQLEQYLIPLFLLYIIFIVNQL